MMAAQARTSEGDAATDVVLALFRTNGLVLAAGHRLAEREGLTAAGPPQLPDLIALADRYGLQFGQPNWLPGLITRYGLTPPPGA